MTKIRAAVSRFWRAYWAAVTAPETEADRAFMQQW